MWDAFQREVLAALGHDVLVLAAAADARGTDGMRAVPAPAIVADVPPLQQALLRAVGGDAAKLDGLPPLAQLRTPAAKRALWPRLRTLRRS